VSRAVLDLNAHILPGVHAAVPDVAAGVGAARALIAAGVTTAVTPATCRNDPGAEMRDADEARTTLAQALAEADLPLELLPGAVVPFDRLPSLTPDQLALATIGGGGRWLMVSLPESGWPLRINDLMRGLDMAGLGLVVAHPEQAESVQLNPDRLRDVLGRGALVQVSAGSLAGANGPRAERSAFDLLRNGMVTVVASDASSNAGNGLDLGAAAEAVAAVLRRPPEQVAWMFDEGPRAIADGLAVRPPQLVPQPREARQP
jgi:protein-tyrosine phosphatase